ncbi:hypothetical protein NE237_006193 [Protea cynaroides]|uniref:Uncharacterized protein n=1 Tax=Protea cynaroides TaxID=273540 RepID=A0A9Q0QVB0_9MAGN|nr:hypothetical protein NE237_006193 [Protea cynaroides]
MVSIGPYHHPHSPDTNLEAMEKHKLKYLGDMLERTIEITSLEMYVEAIEKLEPEARMFYSEPIDFNSEEFIEMMLIDGFFIIELFQKKPISVSAYEADPIFRSSSITARVMRDLVLLKNQIPMSVLKTLFYLSRDSRSIEKLVTMALNFFDPLIPYGWYKYPINNKTLRHKHLLDLLYFTLSISLPKLSIISDFSVAQESMPSVMELQRFGVKFKKGSSSKNSDSLIHIKFYEGVLEIPPLCIHDQTDSIFRNLIAYEKCHYTSPSYVRTYAILMDYLIKFADDVAFLRNRGIISNQLDNDNKVFSFFSGLSKGISSNGFYYLEICDKVNDYCFSNGKRK